MAYSQSSLLDMGSVVQKPNIDEKKLAYLRSMLKHGKYGSYAKGKLNKMLEDKKLKG